MHAERGGSRKTPLFTALVFNVWEVRPSAWDYSMSWVDCSTYELALHCFSPFLVFLNHVPEDVQVAFQAPLVFN